MIFLFCDSHSVSVAVKGEETSKPELIYRDKEQPNYEAPKASKPGE